MQDDFNILLKLKNIPISLLSEIETPLSNPDTFEAAQEMVRKSGLSSVGFDKKYIFDKIYSILLDLDKKEDEYLEVVRAALIEINGKKVYHYSKKRKEIYTIEPHYYNMAQHEPSLGSLPTKIWNNFGGKSFTVGSITPTPKNRVRRGWLELNVDFDSIIESVTIESMIDKAADINSTRNDIRRIAEAIPTLFSIPSEKTHLLNHCQVLIQHEDKSFYLVYSNGFDLLLNFEPVIKCKI
jgi:hypothetical protein